MKKQIERLIAAELSHLGYQREYDGSTVFGKWYGDKVGSAAYYSADWCMMFLAYCAMEAGIPTDIIPFTASCPTCLKWAEERGLRTGADEPAQPGDILLYMWASNTDGKVDHVALVESVEGDTADEQIIHTIEGNRGNTVKRCTCRYRDTEVYAIWRPQYEEDPVTEPDDVIAAFEIMSGFEPTGVWSDELRKYCDRYMLQKGATGHLVFFLQYLLQRNGLQLYGGSDGQFGDYTRQAVIQYQDAHDLQIDGLVGSETWASLLDIASPL